MVNSRGIWLLCSRIFEAKGGRIKRHIQFHFNVIPTFALCGTGISRGYETGVCVSLCAHVCSSGTLYPSTSWLVSCTPAIERDSLSREYFKIILNGFLMVAEHMMFSAPRTERLSMSRSSNHLNFIQVSNTIRITNLRTMTWAEHVARSGEKEEIIQNFDQKSRKNEITRKN